jgi:Flp pilus assembly protein TadD
MRTPDDALDAMRLLSHMYMEHGRPDSALALLRALCLLAPEDRRAMRAMAKAAIRAGQPQEAERAIHRLRDEGDPSPVLHLLQGQALAALGRQAEAERAFTEFVESRRATRPRAEGARA